MMTYHDDIALYYQYRKNTMLKYVHKNKISVYYK